MTIDPPIANGEDIHTYRHLLLGHISQLTGVPIDASDIAVVAGHEPQLMARWLQHAYRVAALHFLADTYLEAIDVVHDSVCGQHWTIENVESTAAWLTEFASCLAQTRTAAQQEITVFLKVCEEITANASSFDLVRVHTLPAGADFHTGQQP
jgi:hypothetical protein